MLLNSLAGSVDKVVGQIGRPIKLVTYDGQEISTIAHVRTLRAFEIIGTYQETDMLAVIPASKLPEGYRPRKLDRIEAEGVIGVFIEDPRAVYAGAILVSFKGVLRGQS